jgi:hypothetical protein
VNREDDYRGYIMEHGYTSSTPVTDGERGERGLAPSQGYSVFGSIFTVVFPRLTSAVLAA